LVDVDVGLGGAFPKGDSEFRGQFLSFFGADDFIIEHIALISDQYFVDVHICVLLDLRDPVADALETASVGDVVYE
jgi:hypothetical protein